jgi:hypothetical protein
MSRYLSALFLFIACAVGAADLERVTLTITVTNPPVTGYSLTVNSSERIWTNATTSTTITTNSTVNNSATNLFLHIAASSFGTPRLILQWANTNEIRLIGQPGQVISATTNGLWATLALSTQSGPTTLNAIYPFANIIGTTNRTNQASHFVRGMSDYATNSFATNATALLGYVTRGTPVGGSQTVTGATVFHKVSGTNNGIIYGGGYANATTFTNVDAQRVNFKHFADRGENTNGGQMIFYDHNTNAISAIRAATNGIPGLFDAGGGLLWNNDHYAIDLTDLLNGPALLNVASALEYFPLLTDLPLLGRGSNNWTGPNYWSNATNTFANGLLLPAGMTASGGTWTNAFIYNWRSTNAQFFGTNTVRGDLSFDARVNVDLANGDNAGVLLGTNVYLRLMGPTAAYTIAGFEVERAGAYHILQLTNPAISITIGNESGLEATAANRILTGEGIDLVLTNNPAFLQIIRDGAASRWRVVTHSR